MVPIELATRRLRETGTIDVRLIDPRDETWEIVRPPFRVYFWTGTASEEYELSGTDVHGVIEWAEAQRGDRTYTLYACANVDGLGLIRLAGVDPSAEQISQKGIRSTLLVPSDLPAASDETAPEERPDEKAP